MGIQIPVTLVPNSKIQTHHHEIPDEFHRLPFYFVIMIPNFAGTISKAIRRNDTSFAVFFVSIYVAFVFSRLCLSKYMNFLPKNEKLIQQFWLKFEIWFLYTVITVGFVYQLADFNPTQTTVAMYIAVAVCSLFLLFVFVIVDLVEIWDEIRLPENQMIDAGKLNCYAVSIWDKV